MMDKLILEDEEWLQPNVRGGMYVNLTICTKIVKKNRGMGTSSAKINHLPLVPQVCEINQNK